MSQFPRPADQGDDKPSKAQQHVEQYRTKLEEQILFARKFAEMTATSAWQATYRENSRSNSQNQHRLANGIIGHAETIRMGSGTEETEKAIKDLLKDLAESRQSFQAYRVASTNRIEMLVDSYETLCHQCVRAARDEEMANTLVAAGLASEVSEIMGKFPLITWDDVNGTITVTDRDGPRVASA
jgi:DNA-directed RNA polymerase beta' subunit